MYADEVDMLNMALFGVTSKQWRIANPNAEGNLRDTANIEQLVISSNMESINSVLIHQGLKQSERLIQLNKVAITQMKSLLQHAGLKRLKYITTENRPNGQLLILFRKIKLTAYNTNCNY